MVSGLKSEHVFKMAARVSSTSSEEMASSSEDSASDDPINIAKGRGADLKEPEKAEIARTRKVQRNQAGGKKTVRKHINSVKHNDAKRAIQNSKKRDQSLLTFLRRKDEEDNPKGETLPEDMRLFRFDLVEAFLSAGIPLSKIDHLRSFLEKYGHWLTAHGHLSQMIPSIIEKEKETLKTELSLVDGCSVIFDGSTRLGEALAIVVRFVDDEWNVQQRLIRLQVLGKSLKANELA